MSSCEVKCVYENISQIEQCSNYFKRNLHLEENINNHEECLIKGFYDRLKCMQLCKTEKFRFNVDNK